MKTKDLMKTLFLGLGMLIFLLITVGIIHNFCPLINKILTYSIAVGLVISCFIDILLLLIFGILSCFYEDICIEKGDIILIEW